MDCGIKLNLVFHIVEIVELLLHILIHLHEARAHVSLADLCGFLFVCVGTAWLCCQLIYVDHLRLHVFFSVTFVGCIFRTQNWVERGQILVLDGADVLLFLAVLLLILAHQLLKHTLRVAFV